MYSSAWIEIPNLFVLMFQFLWGVLYHLKMKVGNKI